MRKELPILMSTAMVQATLQGRKTKTRRIIKPQPPAEFYHVEPFEEGFEFYDNHIDSDDVGVWPFSRKGLKCKYGQPGDILYVRENWKMVDWDWEESEVRIGYEDGSQILYVLPENKNPKKDDAYDWMVRRFEWLVQKEIYAPISEESEEMKFTGKPHPLKPSIHLPKWLSRIWLEVVSVRVERLHDITPGDACDEGIEYWDIDGEAMEGGELVADFKNYTWTEKKENDPKYEDRYFPTFANPVDSFRTLWQSINGMESWEDNPWVWVIEFKVLSTDGRPENL